MRDLTQYELGWVVGILEGEGSFTLRSRGNQCYVISVSSTDWDWLSQLHQYLGCGQINGPYEDGRSKTYRPFWLYQITRKADAREVMELVLPYLGERRQQRIREILGTP